MSDLFDPYYHWLELNSTQPPDHYELLGLVRFERDTDRILDAAEHQRSRVANASPGDHFKAWQQLLMDISRARQTLTNPSDKLQYDETLRRASPDAAKQASATPSVRQAASTNSPIVESRAVISPGKNLLPPPRREVPVVTPEMEQTPPAAPVRSKPEKPQLEGPKAERLKSKRQAKPAFDWGGGFGAARATGKPAGAIRPAAVKPQPGGAVATQDNPASAQNDSASAGKSRMLLFVAAGVLLLGVIVGVLVALTLGWNSKATENVDSKGVLEGAVVVGELKEVKNDTESGATSSSVSSNVAAPPSAGPLRVPSQAFIPPRTIPIVIVPTDVELQQEAALQTALRAVRQDLSQRKLSEAKSQIDTARKIYQGAWQQGQIADMELLLQQVELFWSAVQKGVEGLETGTELKVGDSRVMVVETGTDLLTVRTPGKNQSYAIREIPSGLAMVLARRGLNSDAGSKLVLGSFLFVDPEADRVEAVKLLDKNKDDSSPEGRILKLMEWLDADLTNALPDKESRN